MTEHKSPAEHHLTHDAPLAEFDARSIEEKLEGGVKVAVLGPPHSGKTLLIHELLDQLGNESARLDVSRGDGEGQWLHDNVDNTAVTALRRKRTFNDTDDDLRRTAQQVRSFRAPLVLLDVGGQMNEGNKRVISGATHALILGRNQEELDQYTQFAHNAGLEVIGTFQSGARDNELAIYSDVSRRVLGGGLERLDRGKQPPDHTLLGVTIMAENLKKLVAENRKFQPIEMPEAASVQVTPETIIRALHGEQNMRYADVALVYDSIKQLDITKDEEILINGRARAWEYGALLFAALETGARGVSFYSPDGIVPIKPAHLGGSLEDQTELVVTPRGDETVVIELIPQAAKLTTDITQHLQVPLVESNQTVIISGRVPFWLSATAALTYRNVAERIAYFIPGEDVAPVVWARDKSQLGTVVSVPARTDSSVAR